MTHLLGFLAHAVLWHAIGRLIWTVPGLGVLVLAVLAALVLLYRRGGRRAGRYNP